MEKLTQNPNDTPNENAWTKFGEEYSNGAANNLTPSSESDDKTEDDEMRPGDEIISYRDYSNSEKPEDDEMMPRIGKW